MGVAAVALGLGVRPRGTSAVGLLGLVRVLPAAAALPFGSTVADHFPRQRVLCCVYAAQALLLAGVAAAIRTAAPHWLIFVVVALIGVLAAPCRPAQLALAPVLSRTPSELVAANVASLSFEGAATLLGPALAGVLMALSGPPLGVAAAAAAALGNAVLVGGLGGSADPTRAARQNREPVRRTLTGGVHELMRVPDLALIVGGFWAQTFVRGMLNVTLVALAIDRLRMGDGGVGILNAAFGAGGVAGAALAMGLVGRRRLSRPFLLGLTLWGLPLLAVAAVPSVAVAVVALALGGIGNARLDVAGFTLLQRLAEDRVLGRVFGVMYIGILTTIGAGSILAPVVIHAVGIRGTLAAEGALLPVTALLLVRRLGRADDRALVPEPALTTVAHVPLFEPLPPTSLEKLARSSTPLSVGPGQVIVREGDHGESFFAIQEGAVAVTRGDVHLRELGAGESFGEIALLRDIPRTATVTAVSHCRLLRIQRVDFLCAVLGSRESAVVAEETITRHLDDVPMEAAAA